VVGVVVTLAGVRIAVVGAGVVGLSVTARLLARGADVTCYERSGSVMGERSAGSSRIFRLAHPTPALVRLAQRSRAGFGQWEAAAGGRMVGTQKCALSLTDLAVWASAMENAGAPFEVIDGPSERLRVPAVKPPAAALVDPSGGVIDVDAVRVHLVAQAGHTVVHEPVHAVDDAGSTWSPSGRAVFDAVLIAAGAGTPPLAEQVGISVPSTLAHHVRFTFPIADTRAWQCWIDKPADGLGTYQHQSEPGTWAVGGSLDPSKVAWEVGRHAATEASREAVTAYVREHLVVEPTVLESLHCTTVSGLGDGFTVHRSGAVVTISGENLFKLAPLLGEVLADACLAGSTPTVEELAVTA
jgi:sarcosine oxidase